MTKAEKIYLVDDDAAARESLAVLLKTAGYSVEAFASGVAFLERVDKLQEGCVILDLRMPEIDGMEVQKRLVERNIAMPIVMVTGHGDVPLAVQAVKAGAWDFVEKPYSESLILNSVGSALQSARERRETAADCAAFAGRIELLTARERDVLHNLVVGLSNKEIAVQLNISPRTVEIHRARVMGKLEARNYAELIRCALLCGLER